MTAVPDSTSPIGTEVLDQAGCPDHLVRATLRDISVANRLLGGRAAVAWGVNRLLRDLPRGRPVTLLDAGSGGGDIARYLTRRAARGRREVRPILLDRLPAAAEMSDRSGFPSVVADVLRLPLPSRSVDIVLASQLLHHFSRPAGHALLRELDRVARIGVVIADLRRAHIAALGIWLASFALGFHPVTRKDGVTSVRRGFTPEELSRLLLSAGIRGTVSRRPGYRLVAVWQVATAHG